jgi:hypothetical protein
MKILVKIQSKEIVTLAEVRKLLPLCDVEQYADPNNQNPNGIFLVESKKNNEVFLEEILDKKGWSLEIYEPVREV